MLVTVQCHRCGKSFAITPSRFRHGEGKFCSRTCRAESMTLRVNVVCCKCGKTFRVARSKVKNGRGKYCSKLCAGFASRPLVERFWSKVKKTETCWLWTGAKSPAGYGYIKLSSEGAALVVLHDCPGGDNPSCVNPDHLWLGTQADNVADMDKKGRRVSKALRGAEHWRHRKTASQI